ncbi:hypothetical protein SAG0136_02805, partial [Streptococcus agalactiae LMG 14747]
IELSHMILSNDGLVAFHYKSYGIFCVHSKSPTTSAGEVPTIEIIEPLFFNLFLYVGI